MIFLLLIFFLSSHISVQKLMWTGHKLSKNALRRNVLAMTDSWVLWTIRWQVSPAKVPFLHMGACISLCKHWTGTTAPDSHQVSQPTVPFNYSNIKNHTELINQPSPELEYHKIFIIKLGGGKGNKELYLVVKNWCPIIKKYIYISMNTTKHRVRCLSHYRWGFRIQFFFHHGQ